MPVTDASSDAIRTSGLRKSFRVKDRHLEAVSGIDLVVAAGQISGFLGPNGAGKTTTAAVGAGFLVVAAVAALSAWWGTRSYRQAMV